MHFLQCTPDVVVALAHRMHRLSAKLDQRGIDKPCCGLVLLVCLVAKPKHLRHTV